MLGKANQIFDFYVAQNQKFACHWIDSGTHWYVAPAAVLVLDAPGEVDTAVIPYNKGNLNEKLVADRTAVYPENFLTRESVKVGKDFLDCFCLGKQFVSFSTNAVVEAETEHPARHYKILCPLVEQEWDNFTEAEIVFNRATGNPALRLSFEGGYLLLTYGAIMRPEELKFKVNETTYIPAQWSDQGKSYKKIRKENKMPLKAFDTLVKDTLGDTSEALKFDPNKPGNQNDGKTGSTMKEAVAAVKETPAETPAEKPVEPSAETEVKETVKRTRKKAETTPVTDLTKVIEQLSGAAPQDLSAEDTLKALRQLRDLQLAAVRRSANIAIQYVEGAQQAVTKLAAIKAAL